MAANLLALPDGEDRSSRLARGSHERLCCKFVRLFLLSAGNSPCGKTGKHLQNPFADACNNGLGEGFNMGAIATSLFDLFKIGPGPSSSHTIGPMKAACHFLKYIRGLPFEETRSASRIEVCLYGSLSATGKSHGTDRAIAAGLLGWEPESCDSLAFSELLHSPSKRYHIRLRGGSIAFQGNRIRFGAIKHSYPFQNTMLFRLFAGNRLLAEKEIYSLGGGFIRIRGEAEKARQAPVHRYSNMAEFIEMAGVLRRSVPAIMLENEAAITGATVGQICDRLDLILHAMLESVDRGLKAKGTLPGPIGLARKAGSLYRRRTRGLFAPDRALTTLSAYALAASEENAAGHKVVTAPTLGSAGILPAFIYALRKDFHVSKEALRQGLLAAALIGFIARHNASIAGAEVGCQGEVGVASAMGAAMLAYINSRDIRNAANAAEISLEHHLGLTCDPVAGYVQIPCIERNAIGAVHAYSSYLLALAGDPKKQKVKFDQVVHAMLVTGRDMSSKYKETSKGGLAVCVTTC